MRWGLRAKLLLVALVLAAIPWLGYLYVKGMEALLREGQEQALVATARGAAAALHDRPALLELRGGVPATGELELILKSLARSESRIWIVDREQRLLAITGDLRKKAAAADERRGPLDWMTRPLRPLTSLLLERPSEDFDDALPEAEISGGRAVASALQGVPAWRWRQSPDARAVILSAAHPIWAGEQVVAAVVVEETTNAIRSLSNRALEQLAAVTLLAFALGALSLLAFATRLSARLRRLRDEAEDAIDSQGRVRRLIAGSGAGDEIGDLSRSFSTALERIAQYNAYLENLRARLTHELRTPIVVVRSSLENLKLQPMPAEAQVYMGRAAEGLERLDTVLKRMTEVTRLEQFVRAPAGGERAARERFDAREVVRGCAAGYAAAYPARRFELALPETPVVLEGAPDLYAQLLDKLAANAADFATGEEPIRIRLDARAGHGVLTVSNAGPLLPPQIEGRLFDSMTSVRSRPSDRDPHLGLGLYIVRLIAEFHGGRARAANREDGSGVVFKVECPAL